jgi:hypothetical protein
MSPRFTILLPLIRPPVYLPLALESVRAQSVQEFEVFIVCDGAPQETVDYAREQEQLDPRIRAFSFPKGERFGEAHWHAALQEARGQFVVHLEDDDLWFPNHLEEMGALLSSVDFGHTLHTWLHADGRIETLLSDVSNEEFRKRFLAEKFNRFGYSTCGYRIDAYRRLSEGWGPAPPDVWTDLHMWRRFFRTDGMTFGTRMSITSVGLAEHRRSHIPDEEKIKANQDAWKRVSDEGERSKIVQAAWASVVGAALTHESELLATRNALGEATDARAAHERASSDARLELENTRRALRDALNAHLVNERAATAVRNELREATDVKAALEQNFDTAQLELERARYALREAAAAKAAHERALNAVRRELRDAHEAHEQAANAIRDELLQAQRNANDTELARRAELAAIFRSKSWRIGRSIVKPLAMIRNQLKRLF